MQRVFRLISHRPWLVLGALLALTALAAAPLVDWEHRRLHLEVDMSTDRLLPENQPGRTFYDYVRKAFGSDETMVVALSADDIFTHDVLVADRAPRRSGWRASRACTTSSRSRTSPTCAAPRTASTSARS